MAGKAKSLMGKTAKVIALAVGAIAVVGVLAVIALMIPPVQDLVFTRALDRANAQIPGAIAADDLTWRFPATFEARGLLWADVEDTLASVGELRVSASLLPMIWGDLQIQELIILDAGADVPAIRRLFPADTVSAPTPRTSEPEGEFPRRGSLKSLPSIAVENLQLRSNSVRLGEDLTIEGLELSGGADLRYERQPRIRLERLSLKAAGGSRKVSGGGDVRGAPGEDGAGVISAGLDRAAIDIDMATGSLMGTAAGRLSPEIPFVLRVVPDGQDSFSLLLAGRREDVPPEDVGLLLRGKLVRFDGYVGGIRFDAVTRVPDVERLRELPQISPRLEGLPSLEGLTVAISGAIEFHSGFAASVEADVVENSWIQTAALKAAYRDGSFSLEKFFVELPDLQADAQAWLRADSVTAQVAMHATGTRWLELLRPGAPAPDELSAGLFAQVDGPRAAPEIEANLEISARRGDLALDRLRLDAFSGTAQGSPIELNLLAEAEGMRLAGSAEVFPPSQGSKELIAKLSPFVINDISNARVPTDGPRDCRVSYRTDTGEARIESLSLTGALGAASLSGTALNDERGRKVIESRGRVSLQTKRLLGPFLPEGALIDDLGPVRGGFELNGLSGEKGFDFAVSLDLSETAWLDRATVRGRRSGDRLEVDSLAISFEGLDLTAAGSVAGETLDAGARLNLTDARLLKRLYPTATEETELSVSGSADLAGTAEEPRIEASLSGNLARPGLIVPSMEARTLWNEDGIAASFHAEEGLVAGPLRFDSVKAEFGAGERGPFPAEVSLEADGRDIGFKWLGTLSKGTGGEWKIGADDLYVSVRGRDLKSTGPFALTLQPADSSVRVDGLYMAGSLGSLRAGGYVRPGGSQMKIGSVLSLPEDPSYIDVPKGLWPKEVEIDVSVAGARDFDVGMSAKGISMGDRSDLEMSLLASRAPGGLRSTITLSHDGVTLLDGVATLPVSVSLYPPAAAMEAGPVLIDIETTGLPIPVQSAEGSVISISERTAELSARLAVRGDARNPRAFANARVEFPSWPKMKKYSVSMSCKAEPSDAEAGRAQDQSIPFSISGPIPDLDGPGLAVYFELTGQAKKEVTGTFVYPLTWSLSPPDARALEDGELRLQVASSNLDLSEFDNLLPPNYGLGGTAAFNIKAEGPVLDPKLEGRFEANDMRVSTADGSRVTARGEVELSGRRRSPSLEGAIEIQNGEILIPDKPRELLPSEGGAILWELDEGSVEEIDGRPGAGDASPKGAPVDKAAPSQDVGREPGDAAKVAAAQDTSATSIDLDVAVVIPAGLWIRGRGLQVELAGDLRLIQKGDAPTVAGELKAVRGRLVLLGRQFTVERGGAVFYGGDEIDPALDLVLATNVGSTIIRVLFGGTAKKPSLRLTSEPELPEGDIMSLLVFGRTTDELDNDQVDLLGRRATDMAAAFGTSKLETQLAQQLGLDMVRFGKESGNGGGSSLVIGKYLNPKVLLKYEQVLEDRARFFVNLEYFLTQHFKVETLIGHQSQSAVELNWTKDY